MMKYAAILSLSALSLFYSDFLYAQKSDSLRYEIMLSRKMLDTSLVKSPFINSIDVSKNNYITLSTEKNIYLLGWGGMTQLCNESDSSFIYSFAYTPDGLLMAVKGNQLFYLNETGDLMPIVQLPGEKMNLSAGKDVLYLLEQERTDNQYRMYAFAKGGKYKQLLISPKPVTAAVEMSDSLYLAVGSAVFSFSPKNSSLNLVAGFQKDYEIKSMTADTVNLILYIATGDAIYAIKNNSLVYVTGDFGGGIIKYFKGGLIIFNPQTNDITRIVNIDKSIAF